MVSPLDDALMADQMNKLSEAKITNIKLSDKMSRKNKDGTYLWNAFFQQQDNTFSSYTRSHVSFYPDMYTFLTL